MKRISMFLSDTRIAALKKASKRTGHPSLSERKGTMRAAIYARVSTVGNGQSPEMQLQVMRKYCDRRGWTVAGEYENRHAFVGREYDERGLH
jgi:hypothetical protein